MPDGEDVERKQAQWQTRLENAFERNKNMSIRSHFSETFLWSENHIIIITFLFFCMHMALTLINQICKILTFSDGSICWQKHIFRRLTAVDLHIPKKIRNTRHLASLTRSFAMHSLAICTRLYTKCLTKWKLFLDTHFIRESVALICFDLLRKVSQ